MKITDIKKRIFIVGLLDVFFLILPGILFLYIYQPEIFNSFDWIKLSLLSGAITTPFIFLNCIILMVVESKNEKNKDFIFNCLSASIIMTGLVMYLFIAIDYFILNNIIYTVKIFLVLEIIIFFISACLDYFRSIKKKNSKSDKTEIKG